jgi:hypothetical protein
MFMGSSRGQSASGGAAPVEGAERAIEEAEAGVIDAAVHPLRAVDLEALEEQAIARRVGVVAARGVEGPAFVLDPLGPGFIRALDPHTFGATVARAIERVVDHDPLGRRVWGGVVGAGGVAGAADPGEGEGDGAHEASRRMVRGRRGTFAPARPEGRAAGSAGGAGQPSA